MATVAEKLIGSLDLTQREEALKVILAVMKHPRQSITEMFARSLGEPLPPSHGVHHSLTIYRQVKSWPIFQPQRFRSLSRAAQNLEPWLPAPIILVNPFVKKVGPCDLQPGEK